VSAEINIIGQKRTRNNKAACSALFVLRTSIEQEKDYARFRVTLMFETTTLDLERRVRLI